MKEYSAGKDLGERVLKDFPRAKLERDDVLYMYEKHIEKLKLRKKTTTVRYKKDAIRYPSKETLPLIQTKPNSEEKKEVGELKIEKIVIKEVKELTETDAVNDGFKNKEELISVIENIYGKIKDNELVSIYHISKLPFSSIFPHEI